MHSVNVSVDGSFSKPLSFVTGVWILVVKMLSLSHVYWKGLDGASFCFVGCTGAHQAGRPLPGVF